MDPRDHADEAAVLDDRQPVVAALGDQARGLAPHDAACAAVFAHLRAGGLAAAPHGPDGVIASDVIGQLSRAFGG